MVNLGSRIAPRLRPPVPSLYFCTLHSRARGRLSRKSSIWMSPDTAANGVLARWSTSHSARHSTTPSLHCFLDSCCEVPTRERDDRAPAVDKASRVIPYAADSSQETIRHTDAPAYRCFLPDLTGFAGRPLRRARLSTPLTTAEPQKARPRAGIRPRYSGLRVQGTASSPSSTIKLAQNGRLYYTRRREIMPAC